MFYPSFDEVLRLKNSYTMIPICQKVWSDNVTPIRLFQQMKQKYSFLLESVEGGENWARHSFIGSQPFLLFSVHDGQGKMQWFSSQKDSVPSIVKEETCAEPIPALKKLLKRYRVPNHLSLPPFTGGAVGYIGYDAMTLVEDIPDDQQQVRDQDQIRLMFCDEMIAFDHLQQELSFISHLRVDGSESEAELKAAYDRLCQRLRQRIQELFQRIKDDDLQMFQLPPEKVEVDWSKVRANFDQHSFEQAVEKIKSYIRAGDVSQTVLSQRFSVDVHTDPFHIYRVLRMVNPSPYLYYMDLGDGIDIIGSSPERLVKVEGGLIETNPIAGTRPRGQTTAEDERLAQELLADAKERAEHHMLVDLGRNDVGRVARFGSVKVNKQMEVEKFSHVMHMCSTVQGELAEKHDAVDSLLACFPAGTVTGAPKIRAMEILAELEHEARHAYAGAVGYFSFSGNLDSCIAIRTLFVDRGKAHIQAGAGVVADSVPEKEWQETRNKARALLVAVQLAEQIFTQSNKGEHQYV